MKKLSLTQSCVKAVYQLKKTVLRNEKVINITAMACEFHVWFIDGDWLYEDKLLRWSFG